MSENLARLVCDGWRCPVMPGPFSRVLRLGRVGRRSGIVATSSSEVEVRLSEAKTADPLAGSGSAARRRAVCEVVDRDGRARPVWVRVGTNVVEVWLGEECCAVMDREALRSWLVRRPKSSLMAGEVVMSVDRLVDTDGRVALTLPGVDAWTLSPNDEQRLLRFV